ncbi:hypothetical protein PoB_004484800 [Plakobranchus ocellatus]|uniref:VWFA domain-containing protein n=1 Tax=Plakobranchus ocellatus TaxID=259542 RepID=A0AAV4BHP8_9GAST|nr:hypothetical protein PoB_004484800 [Plakobranchus ocellatus]
MLLLLLNKTACQGFADIVIAIDDSSSTQRSTSSGGVEVAPGQFSLAEYYIQNSLLNTDNINIALMAHSFSGRVLSGFSNDSTSLNASLTFTPQYSISNTASGLGTSTDLHLQTGRSGAARFTILLLDSGTSNIFITFAQASRARDNGVYVMPVAFGNDGAPSVSDLELSLLGANNAAFFKVNDDADLIGLVTSITAVVCPGRISTTSAATTSPNTVTPTTTTSVTQNTEMTSTTPSGPAAACSELELINSIAHVRDPSDEAKFIQCFQNVSEITSTSMFCKFGTLWNDDLGTCTEPVDTPTEILTKLWLQKILRICHLDHLSIEDIRRRLNRAIGSLDDLATVIRRRKLKWYGHITRFQGFAKTILQETVQGDIKRKR